MTEHLSPEEIEKFIARESAPAETLRIDDHLAVCAECMQKMERSPSIAAIRDVLDKDDAGGHLLFDTMSRYVDGDVRADEREIADVHLSVCDECSGAVNELREVRKVLNAGSGETAKNANEQVRRSFSIASWWKFAVPAAALIVLAVSLWPLFSSSEPDRSNIPNTNVENAIAGHIPTPMTDPGVVNSNSETKPNSAVVSLNDAGGRIEIDSEGRITGIAADQFGQKIRAALASQTIEVSSAARKLRTSTGALMGPNAPGVPFRLIGPVGRIVEMDRPPFRWQPMKDAESYKVGIYDENFRLIAESPALKTTEWAPGSALPRGRIYQWQVAADVGEKAVISPTRPAPEAKFMVLDADAAAEIQRARRTAGNSRLLMGIVYANAGMLPEAEREFQALVQKNPGSQIARKLLAKVRSAR